MINFSTNDENYSVFYLIFYKNIILFNKAYKRVVGGSRTISMLSDITF